MMGNKMNDEKAYTAAQRSIIARWTSKSPPTSTQKLSVDSLDPKPV
jgi:hypothetical protein